MTALLMLARPHDATFCDTAGTQPTSSAPSCAASNSARCASSRDSASSCAARRCSASCRASKQEVRTLGQGALGAAVPAVLSHCNDGPAHVPFPTHPSPTHLLRVLSSQGLESRPVALQCRLRSIRCTPPLSSQSLIVLLPQICQLLLMLLLDLGRHKVDVMRLDGQAWYQTSWEVKEQTER